MANQIIPQRSEVPEEYTWNLKDLYESCLLYTSRGRTPSATISGRPCSRGRCSPDWTCRFIRS